jgi:hypothetical protein
MSVVSKRGSAFSCASCIFTPRMTEFRMDDGLVPAVGVIFRFRIVRAVLACHDLGPSYRDSFTEDMSPADK